MSSARGPPRIPSVHPRDRGVKGLRPRIKYDPYKKETKWFKIKKRKSRAPPQEEDKHFVFEAFWMAAYQAPRTCDLTYEEPE